ncbi:carbohydrate ABC transporter permease [candidate division KSB1 bacterium]|nr:carbohydrate ABC transporter permease [candidate division KSB1 bacterium]
MKKWLFYIVLTGAAVTFIYPFLWMAAGSLKPEIEIPNFSLLSRNLSVNSYKVVLDKIPIIRAFFNSVLVATSVTASVLVFSSMVGYALSRLRFRGRELIFTVILFTMMIPFQLTLIPLYTLIVKFGWTDTYWALIVPYMINAFGILLFRQYFKAVPQDLIDAARVDGCGELRILFRIIWPLSVPALVTVGIIVFMMTWNEVLWPLIVVRKETIMTMPQMVTLFAVGGRVESQVGVKLAAAMMLTLPIVIVYLFFQRHFIASMATTGLKG